MSAEEFEIEAQSYGGSQVADEEQQQLEEVQFSDNLRHTYKYTAISDAFVGLRELVDAIR